MSGQAFFGAFIDKEIAYRMPHALGLVTFGNVVTEELAITREFEAFATLFGEISKLQGATHLLDAVVRASGLIDEYCLKNANLLAPDCARRILCLSDGEVETFILCVHAVCCVILLHFLQDSGSKETCETALKALQKAKCILDSVPIEGIEEESLWLRLNVGCRRARQDACAVQRERRTVFLGEIV
jgi:hypothetical protein